MSQEKILIVEDEPRVSQALCRVLTLPEGGGYAVQSCESGEEALALVRQARFDLVITDLRMPGMSGLELLEQVHQISPTTCSILITAFGTPQVEDTAHRLANAYLPKPFSMRNFVQTVRQTLTVAPATTQRLTAFSEQGLRAIQERIESLRHDLAALGILLLDPSGQLLTETGRHGEFDTNAFLALLGNAMAAANEVAHMLRDSKSFDLHFHEGDKYEIYTARITDQVFLCLILERHAGSSRIGMVWLALRRAIAELRQLLVEATISIGNPLGEDLKAALGNALDEALDLHEGPSATTVTLSDPERAAPQTRSLKTAVDVALDEVLKPAEVTSDSVETPAPSNQAEGDQVLSFEQARALGLIQLDRLERG